MSIKVSFSLGLCALLTVSACTQDKDEYLSTLPTFSGFKVENLTHTDSKYLYKGDQVRITALQSSKGNLLYKATYTWTFKPGNNSETKTIYYDSDNGDPSWTFTVDSLAVSKLFLTAEYYASGTGIKVPSSVKTTDGSTANYSANSLYGRITLQRDFTVLSPQ